MDKEHPAMLVGTCDAQGKKENNALLYFYATNDSRLELREEHNFVDKISFDEKIRVHWKNLLNDDDRTFLNNSDSGKYLRKQALEEEYTKWITNEKLRENGQVNTYDSSGNSQSVNSSGSMKILGTRGVRTRAEVVDAHISPKRIRLELPPVESTD
ncbi:hypothetical protein ACHAPC_006574 [Botrytis cinerea]